MSTPGGEVPVYTAKAVFEEEFGEPEVTVYAGDEVLVSLPLGADGEPGVVLEAAGWTVVGVWTPSLYGGSAVVRPRAGTTPPLGVAE